MGTFSYPDAVYDKVTLANARIDSATQLHTVLDALTQIWLPKAIPAVIRANHTPPKQPRHDISLYILLSDSEGDPEIQIKCNMAIAGLLPSFWNRITYYCYFRRESEQAKLQSPEWEPPPTNS